MNRRKKLTQIFKKKDKAKKAKLNPQKKPRYITKAERDTLAQQTSSDTNSA